MIQSVCRFSVRKWYLHKIFIFCLFLFASCQKVQVKACQNQKRCSTFFEAHLSKQLHPKKASKNTSISRSLAFIYLKCVENCDLFCENIFYTSLKRGMHLLKNACEVIYNYLHHVNSNFVFPYLLTLCFTHFLIKLHVCPHMCKILRTQTLQNRYCNAS